MTFPGRRWVYAALAVFALGYVVMPPRAFLVVDEERYVAQAVAFSQGALTVPNAGIVHPATPTRLISNFPPGTSLLQAPLVWLGGWRMAGVLSVLGLIAATLVTMRWLRESGRHEGFALLVPGFAGAAFFGRIAMSDVPSAAIVAVSCWLLWRAERSRPGTSFAAGLAAGAGILFREPLVVLLAPLVAGALLRRSVHAGALIAGGALAVGARLVLGAALFGDLFYVRPSGYGFSPASLAHSLPVFAVLLLVLFPLGALLPLLYRGPRRAELCTAVAAYVALFLLYEYDSISENGPVKGLMLASRYVVPALPPLAFMASDVWPRWHGMLPGRARAWSGAGARVAAAGVLFLCAGVHLVARKQEAASQVIVREIQAHTNSSVPVLTNSNATLKYLSPAYGPRRLVLRYHAPPDSLVPLLRAYGTMDLVLLDRSDSELFTAESRDNERYLDAVRERCSLRLALDTAVAAWARLRVARIASCRA